MALRLFDEHQVRPVRALDGLWDFVTADERNGRDRLPTSYNRQILVPSAWEMLPELENYRGTAWLRTRVQGAPGRRLRLAFGGVSHTGRVYIDGTFVGEHYDAFTPWAVVAPATATGEHELVVEVDNSFGEHSALHIENDYFTYGGITRPVEAQLVPDCYIDRLCATPQRVKGNWQLPVRVRLCNLGRAKATRHVRVACAGCTLELGRRTVGPGDCCEVEGTLEVGAVAPWTAAEPALYRVSAALVDGDEVVDDLIDRVGFRELTVSGRKFLINGEPLHLRGYNRHEDHPQFGCAIPVPAMITDLELMRDLNCNFVRTCHYPNDMRFLDLCDELGVYVWEESHARSVDFNHPKFREQITSSTTEMLDWHHNHPAIVIWGCLNECESETQAGRKQHKYVIDLIKKADRSRPVTFASNRGTKDLCLDLVDIVSWNRYDAWYGGGPQNLAPVNKQMLAWLHSTKTKSGGRNKPVIMSEFGAGGIYGYRHPRHAKWTEEYMAEVLDASLQLYLYDRRIVGAAIWQFCDVRLTPEWWGGRPRNMNNKGTVDEYRRPKLCYDVVKRRLAEAAASRQQ